MNKNPNGKGTKKWKKRAREVGASKGSKSLSKNTRRNLKELNGGVERMVVDEALDTQRMRLEGNALEEQLIPRSAVFSSPSRTMKIVVWNC